MITSTTNSTIKTLMKLKQKNMNRGYAIIIISIKTENFGYL